MTLFYCGARSLKEKVKRAAIWSEDRAGRWRMELVTASSCRQQDGEPVQQAAAGHVHDKQLTSHNNIVVRTKSIFEASCTFQRFLMHRLSLSLSQVY
jgi:hypothetical protein